MKIALVNNQFQFGGAETVASQLRKGIAQAGHDVSFHVADGKTYPSGVKAFYPEILSRAYHTRFNGLVERFAPRFAWMDRSFRRLANSDADIIHLHNFHGNYASLESLAYMASRKKLVWTFHALWGVTGGCDHPKDCRGYLNGCGECPQVGWWPVGPVDHTAEQLAAKLALLADKRIHVAAPSRWLAEIVRNSRVGSKWNVRHIANGIDVKAFPANSATRAAETTILLVNRNFSDVQKGFGIALEALCSIKAQGVKIILAGENSAWAASQLPGEFAVLDAGYVRDREMLAGIYSSADIFLFASPAENFPCVVLEAMAAQCCVVATPTGGVVEQIEHGKSGLLASAINGQSLSAVLQDALADRHLRVSLGCAARERAQSLFSEQEMINGYLKLYREVMDEN